MQKAMQEPDINRLPLAKQLMDSAEHNVFAMAIPYRDIIGRERITFLVNANNRPVWVM